MSDTNKDKDNNKHFEIVIARYNESLEWLQEYPFNDPTILQFAYFTIYNKGDNDNFIRPITKNSYRDQTQTRVIPLPNVGRCDHTYLYHIVTEYERNGLANITLFLPGSLSMDVKKKRAKEIIEEMRKLNFQRAIFIGHYSDTGIGKELKTFQLDSWQCSSPDNSEKNKESLLTKCKIRPYGNWFRYFFGDIRVHHLCYWGIFSIDKRDILQNPANISRYRIFLHNLSLSSNPELGHYIERSWCALFYPMRFTKILRIKE